MGVGLWLKLRVAAEQGGKGQDGWCSDLRPPPNSPPSTHRASRARAAGASVSVQATVTNFPGMGDRGIPG